ncbi:expressed unknown protein [Seminavis robusta]|uniref:Uncharacterized protein n=1 Tax=Seminavis robusta TaxID=568900 RepID=A0A9N8H6Q0_9STRA|nr:expressed unknown protein [Seminavis robusta]|eukprot:Sro154_g070050.1 n/a (199) ;mRNA; f:47200-47796
MKGKSSTVKCFSIDFNSSEQPDFSILTFVKLNMARLTRLDINICNIFQPFQATLDLCNSLCDLLQHGMLEEINVRAATQQEGLLLPLLDAANHSDTLVALRLEKLGKPSEVEIYQDEILRMLKSNTQLEVALVCEGMITENALLERSDLAMRAHDTEFFLDRTEGNDKQRLIDYQTLLIDVAVEKQKQKAYDWMTLLT